MRSCSIRGCEKPSKARGWCDKHWARWKRHGDPLWEPPTFDDRLWAGIDTQHPSGHWWWKNNEPTIYGSIEERVDGRAINRMVHREVYKRLVGPIPDGYEIDHLCRTPACCRPSHLEAVPPRTNKLRGENPTAHNSRKTHCVNNHEFTPENTHTYYRDGTPRRACRQCGRDRAMKQYKKKVSASVEAAKAS